MAKSLKDRIFFENCSLRLSDIEGGKGWLSHLKNAGISQSLFLATKNSLENNETSFFRFETVFDCFDFCFGHLNSERLFLFIGSCIELVQSTL